MEKDSAGVTRVRFDLWAVLAFLVLLAGISFGYLFQSQAASRDERIKADALMCDRITRLETNYENIIRGIDRLTVTVEKTGDKLEAYRGEVRNKKTKISDLQFK
jgi:hypothetical protein